MGKVIIAFFTVATIFSSYLTYNAYGQNSLKVTQTQSARSNSYHGGGYYGGSSGYNSSGYGYGK